MTAVPVLHGLLGLLPVCCFLAALVYLDSYKLVPLKWVLGVIALGCAAVDPVTADLTLTITGSDVSITVFGACTNR